MELLIRESKVRMLILCTVLCIAEEAIGADVLDLSLEELLEVEMISSVSKMPLKANESPSAIRLITANDINLYGWKSLGEALAALPGVTTVSNRSYDFIGARGLLVPDDYNTRYLMVIDGVPVNDALFESAFIGAAFPIDIALIERIEYMPGAGSSVYGANAMLGTINITTKSGKNHEHTELEGSYSSRSQKKLRVTHVFSNADDSALTISASRASISGQDEYYPGAIGGAIDRDGNLTQTGVAHGLDKGSDEHYFMKLEHGNLNISGYLSNLKQRPSSAPHGANFDDPEILVDDRNFGISGSYTKPISDSSSGYINLTYMGSRNEVTYPRYTFGGTHYLNHQNADAKRFFGEGRLISSWGNCHKTAFGIDWSVETTSRVINFDDANRESPLFDNNRPDRRIGYYLQDQWGFAADWQLTTGVRIDYSKTYGTHVSPRLGLIWQASPGLTLKAVAAQAFRNPNPLEAYAGINPLTATAAPYETLGAPDLSSESIRTSEFITEWRPTTRFEVHNSVYFHKMDSLVLAGMTPQMDFQHQNAYSTDALGIESSLRYRSQSGWNLKSSLAFQNISQSSGKHVSSDPQWMAKAMIDHSLLNGYMKAAWEIHAIGRSTFDWNNQPTRISPYVVTNLSVSSDKLIRNANIHLRINNLLDQKYGIPGSDDTVVAKMPNLGRNATLQILYEF